MAHNPPSCIAQAGQRMAPEAVAAARRQWQAFMRRAPPYPKPAPLPPSTPDADAGPAEEGAGADAGAAAAARPDGSDVDGGGDGGGGRGGGGRFSAAAVSTFLGRGIVLAAGGTKYAVPTWIAVTMLRRAGCKLPVEIWFFRAELPPPPFVAELARMGATCR